MVIFYFVLALAISLFFYRKTIPELGKWNRFFLISLRTISLLIIFILLFNPILNFISKQERKPELLFLIDNSDSMELDFQEMTKSDYLQTAIEDLQKKLQRKNYKIQLRTFANGLAGESYATNLSNTFLELTNQQLLNHTEQIFLFSDGWFHDDELSVMQRLTIPVNTLLTESEERKFDLEITNLTHNKTAFLNETTPIAVSVSSSEFEGKASLKLLADENILAEQEVDFSDNSFQQIHFEHQFGYTGLHKLQAVIEAADLQEAYTKNNIKSSAIQVLKDKMQALVLTDKPNWDAMFMQRIIRQNERWEATYLHQIRNRWYQGNQPTELSEHFVDKDVIFIIRTERLAFSPNENELLKTFCNQGGGLFYKGFPEQSLVDILPYQGRVLARDFQAKFTITTTGKRYQTLQIPARQLDIIPPVPYAYVNPTVQAQVLATFLNEENSPAILYQRYGNGQVVMLPFLDLWKWQMRQSDGAYESFITNILSWISNVSSETFFASTEHLMFRLGDPVTISLTAYDETLSPRFDVQAKVSLTRNGEEVFSDYLVQRDDSYSIQVSELSAGDYQYTVYDENTEQQAEGNFTVSTENPENYDVGFNNTLLAYVSKETHGSTFFSAEEIAEKIQSARTTEETQTVELPLYRKWYFIVLFILAFCLELFFRKRWGLL